jgi:DNA-binding IclR family transcriptional regulator
VSISFGLAGLRLPASEDRNFVTALARGLDILRCFDRPGIELTVSELARRTQLNQPTAWRLSHTLLSCGFLVHAPNGVGLKIGAPALTLGYVAIQGMSFPAIVLPYMQLLTRQTKASTTLSVWQSIEMISIQRCDGEFVAPNQPVGWRTLLTSVPSGLAVLAALPPPIRDRVAAQLQAHEPHAWPKRADRLARAAEDYAKTGYVIRNEMLDGQYAGVAVPLVVADGETVAAWGLSVGGVTTRWTEARLHETGAELNRIRGFLEPALATLRQTEILPT